MANVRQEDLALVRPLLSKNIVNVSTIALCILFISVHIFAGMAHSQHTLYACEPTQETFIGQAKEIKTTSTYPGASRETIRVKSFNASGMLTEVKDGTRMAGTTDTKWRSTSAYNYDDAARVMVVTETFGFIPPVEQQCVLSYSRGGELAVVVRSDSKRFTGASFYVYEDRKLTKAIHYNRSTPQPSSISTFEYSNGIRSREHQNAGEPRSSVRTYDESGRVARFDAYEHGKLIAFETLTYNDKNDLVEWAHYRPDNILVWRDLFSREYDEVGNWKKEEHTQTGETEGGRSGATLSTTTRTITYSSPE